MPGKIFGPHKRRTRAHIIADVSVHYVEGFILRAGHTVQRRLNRSVVLFTARLSDLGPSLGETPRTASGDIDE